MESGDDEESDAGEDVMESEDEEEEAPPAKVLSVNLLSWLN